MSHFAKYEVKIENVEFIKKALIEMGYTYKEGGTVRTDFGEARAAELVVVRNGQPISVGFCKNAKTGELELIADWWGLRIPQNEFTTQLSQIHGKYKVLEMCEDNRWNADLDSIHINADGVLEVHASQFA